MPLLCDISSHFRDIFQITDVTIDYNLLKDLFNNWFRKRMHVTTLYHSGNEFIDIFNFHVKLNLLIIIQERKQVMGHRLI